MDVKLVSGPIWGKLLASSVLLLTVAANIRAQPQGFGNEVGSFNGVASYSNGNSSYVSNISHFLDGKYMGMKWQCVEFCRRFYYLSYGLHLTATGDANSWYSNGHGLSRRQNEGAIAPQVGDILCSASGSAGHVAIIREVGSNYVRVIHQNWLNDNRDNSTQFAMSTSGGTYTILPTTSYSWQGWLSRGSIDPAITLENLPGQRWYRTMQQLPWRVTAGSGELRVEELADGNMVAGYEPRFSGDTGYVQSTTGGLGWHVFSARVRKLSGGDWFVSPLQWAGGFDNVLPTIGRSGGILPNTWYLGIPSVQIAGVDAHSGIKRTRIWIDGGTNFGWIDTAVQSIPFSGNGKYRLYGEAEDSAWTNPGDAQSNNSGATFLGEYWLDNLPPSIPTFLLIPSLPNGLNNWYVTRPTANFSSTDPGPFSSGQAITRYSVNGGSFTSGSSVLVPTGGSISIASFAHDPVGNESGYASTTVKVDTTPPSPPVLIDGGSFTPDQTFFQVQLQNGSDPESGYLSTEYKVTDSDDPNGSVPTWGRNTTIVQSNPYVLSVEGLLVPSGENVFIHARTRNQAGLWSDWGSSDGILVEPWNFNLHLFNTALGSGGDLVQSDQFSLEGTVGETLVHDDHAAASSILGGLWSTTVPKMLHTGSFSVIVGEQFAGDLQSLHFSDNQSFSLFSDSSTLEGVLEMVAVSPVFDGRSLTIGIEARVGRLGLVQQLKLFNYGTGSWQTVAGQVGSSEDSWLTATSLGVHDYIDPALRHILMRVHWGPLNDEDPSQDGWLFSVDYAHWVVVP